jgi:glucokinase
MNDTNAVVGIDIGGTKISAALFSFNGDILQKEIRTIADRKGKHVVELAGELAIHLMDFTRNTPYKVVAIGACVPGIYNPIEKTAWAPNIPGWDNYPLWEELTNLIDDPSIEIVIESDRSCYILGEVWKGNARGCKDAIFVAIGTGIGAGILANGKIITGNRGIAGAIGWMALDHPYDKKYNDCGNFEFYASGKGLVRSACEALNKHRQTSGFLDGISADEITAQHVFKALEKQDPVAIEVINQAVVYWGMAVANLVSIFNPEKVILGGGVFGPATQFLKGITQEATKWAQPLAIQETTVEASSLEGDAGLIGAGYLAIKSLTDKIDDQ